MFDLVWRSHTHEREARGSGVKLDRDLYPAAGILQSNQIAELLVTRLLRHYHYNFPSRGRGLGTRIEPVHHKTSLVFTSLNSFGSQA